MDIIQDKFVDDQGQEHYTPCKHIGPEIKPKYIIMHCTTTGSPFDRNVTSMLRENYDASVHLLIGRAGEIQQFVPFNNSAAHCGDNHWHNVYNSMDSHSIGIEMLNAGKLTTDNGVDYYKSNFGITYPVPEDERVFYNGEWWQIYPQAQLNSALEIVRLLIHHYPDIKDVLGHNEINPGQRPEDPGPAFPMQWFHAQALGLDESLPITRVHVTTRFVRLFSGPGENYERIGDGFPKNTPLGVLSAENGWSLVHVYPDKREPPYMTGWMQTDSIAVDTLKPRHYHRHKEVVLPSM